MIHWVDADNKAARDRGVLNTAWCLFFCFILKMVKRLKLGLKFVCFGAVLS